ncbi:MAG: AAA family ATPase, partial [Anaerolineae bacterium]|nr:AAA family ATPase [Anaerolineae bacterium]
MIERITTALNTDSVNRYRILYGPGIEDHFISDRTKGFIDLETALMMGLKEVGYQRVVFISADEPVYFVDKESMQLTMKVNLKAESPFAPRESRFAGPIGRYNVLGNGSLDNMRDEPIVSDESGDMKPYKEMSDSFALRKIDHLMTSEEGIPTAVVIMQAETFIRHQPDQRTLSAKFGKWQLKNNQDTLPAGNICIFVFSDTNMESLAATARTLNVPELRSFILDEAMHQDVVRLGYPGEDELIRMFREMEIAGLVISEKKRRKAIRAILAEGGKLSLWARRLMVNAQTADSFEINREWFTHYLPGDQTAFEKLRELEGLEAVTQHLKENAALWRTMEGHGEFEPPTLHMMFTGNPGTGKTTVARLVGEIYFEIGLLRRGHLIEARYDDLVGQSIGSTPLKTNQIVDRALDGVLFIDEAYMLTDASRGNFGREALDTLLTRMENNRNRLVVIFA